MEITTVGLDLAKNVFQFHASQHRRGRRPPGVRRAQVLPFFTISGLPGGHGGVRDQPSLGARTGGPGPRGAADAAGLRQAVREARQD